MDGIKRKRPTMTVDVVVDGVFRIDKFGNKHKIVGKGKRYLFQIVGGLTNFGVNIGVSVSSFIDTSSIYQLFFLNDQTFIVLLKSDKTVVITIEEPSEPTNDGNQD